MKRAALLLCAFALARQSAAQEGAPADVATERAESLRAAGRPWHAAETLLEAATREPRLSAAFLVESAEAELHARRYDRCRSLLVGQPWLGDYGEGEALGVLAEAEVRLGLAGQAAEHFGEARAKTGGARAALFTVRQALAWEAAGAPDSAAAAYASARALGLPAIDAWLRLREARVTRDTARAFALLAALPPPVAREAAGARAQAFLVAGDSAAALEAFAVAGHSLDVARLALARRDSSRARDALYGLMARSPESDDAATAVGIALGALPPRTPPERVALARAMRLHGAAADALTEVLRALAQGDSSGPTLLLTGELLTAAGRTREAERVYRAATKDPALGPLAIYRRARMLARLRDPGASEALSGFAQSFPTDTAAPTALYVLADLEHERGERPAAARWFSELIERYPTDARASTARFRLAAEALRDSLLDSATALLEGEVAAATSQRSAARFWLGKLAMLRGDTAGARTAWLALVHEDSVGYYGVRARRETGLAPLHIPTGALVGPPPAVAAALGRLDTLALAGLDTAAQAEVRTLLGRGPQQDVEALMATSEGLALRGYGSFAVRLGWQAALRAPNDSRVLHAIYPWPDRRVVEAEAAEFGVDPYLLVGLVRQESEFDVEALSTAGARGLTQLLPSTAALTARELDVTFYPEWITVPDLNLHLGAAHLRALLEHFQGRVEAAVAAYDAGALPVARWLARPGGGDLDQFIELIPYQETRAYVRSVLRNRELYRALYPPASN